VLFAEVDEFGTVDNDSGGVTADKTGTGGYFVDFQRDVSSCASVATIGPSGTGSTLGQIGVADQNGNNEAVQVITADSEGALDNQPFRLVVVC
jgi:hypothetical protein